jgi:tripartite-type tricarboxylate transporter receptor subunit TctC
MPTATAIVSVIAAGVIALMSPAAHAQAYPDRTVRIIVPFSPGGGADIIARLMAQKLNEKWGQPVVVENKTGANGNIGAQAVAQSKPDGYTIMVGTSALTINPSLNDNVGYQLKDFTPVILLASAPFVLVVNPKVIPAMTAQEFIAYAKAREGTLSWASTSEGNAEHLAGMLFQRSAGLRMNHVPYKGGADALKDVVGGHVGVGFISLPTSQAYLQSGQLRALGMTDTRRAPQMPDVPTLSEILPGFELPTWYAVFMPAGVPSDVVDKVHAAFADILKQDEVKKRVISIGFNPAGGARAEFASYVLSEFDKYATIAAQIGLKKQQ